MDIIFIAICVFYFSRFSPIKGVSDFFGTIMVATLIYAIFKYPLIGMIGGWTFPVSQEPLHVFVSGGIACFMTSFLFLYGAWRKKNPELPPIYKAWKLLKKNRG